METKVGSFEWIASYEEIREYFEWTLKYHRSLRRTQATPSLQVLEIGCGTSGLSEKLSSDFPSLDITCTDYDEACVRHLRRQFPASRNRYEVLDILTEDEPAAVRFDSFDIILDKGTYDALLVEGSVAQVVENVYRLLRADGVYLLFSIHSVDFMKNYFGNPFSGLELLLAEPMVLNGKVSHCSVTLLRRSPSAAFDRRRFAELESDTLDQHYQTENPLLTPYMEMQLRTEFASLSDADGGLPLKRAFEAMFDPALEYDFSLFLEDLGRFEPPLSRPGFITLEEALRFLREMQ